MQTDSSTSPDPAAKSLGQIGYDAFRAYSGGRSLATGATLPEWEGLTNSLRAAWEAAGAALIDMGFEMGYESCQLETAAAAAMTGDDGAAYCPYCDHTTVLREVTSLDAWVCECCGKFSAAQATGSASE